MTLNYSFHKILDESPEIRNISGDENNVKRLCVGELVI